MMALSWAVMDPKRVAGGVDDNHQPTAARTTAAGARPGRG
jgi:hypothetical protein